MTQPKDLAKAASFKTTSSKTARQIAFEALRAIERGAFADVVIDRKLKASQIGTQPGTQSST
ncbi:hypothetical protein, partial [cf. Phormidesmis sp. LEGE 11477]|uniref:hypothetical protein n=1 Tax=cf. Phormidesmis sp. LEGE 11477 TaxID=1828680 RepID=UPI001A02AD85